MLASFPSYCTIIDKREAVSSYDYLGKIVQVLQQLIHATLLVGFRVMTFNISLQQIKATTLFILRAFKNGP